MQVIILAAGQGSRMAPLTNSTHKSLLPLNSHENFLSRILHQLNEYEISKVVIVTGYLSKEIEQLASHYQLNIECIYNKKYKEDTNIYSMKLALDKINKDESTIILEADIYIDDLALRDIINVSKSDKSIWFTKDIFNSKQYGGVLKKDSLNNILDIQIVPNYSEKFKDYFKLLGIMSIGKDQIKTFFNLVNKYCEKTINQYYLIPWIENLKKLPCIAYDLSAYLVESVNRVKEYEDFINYLKNLYQEEKEVCLVNTDSLLDIEEHIIKRKELLKKKIIKENIWTKPIVIEKNHNLVLDGHHRFNLAKELKLKKIPAIKVDYKDIEIWSLKDNELVNKQLVIKKAKDKNIYPNKTVKHKFEFKIPPCSYKLEELK